MTIGVGATRIDRRWQPSELRTMQQRDGEISQVVDQLIVEQYSSKNGIFRRYRQLWTQLEMVDGILRRNVEGARLLVAPTDTRNEILHLAQTIRALDILDLHEHLTIYNSGSIGLACEKTSNSGFYDVRNVDNARHLLLSLERPCRASGSASQWNCGQWTL